MQFFHFTSGAHLRGIARHGLTVGDVPTDLDRNRGVCAVWLTTREGADGHGLAGSAVNKAQYRLTVEVSESDPRLAKWLEWAPSKVTDKTQKRLASADGERFESWWIYLGVIAPENIVECREMGTDAPVDDWPNLTGIGGHVLPGVPAWRRGDWHRALLKKVGRAVAAQR